MVVDDSPFRGKKVKYVTVSPIKTGQLLKNKLRTGDKAQTCFAATRDDVTLKLYGPYEHGIDEKQWAAERNKRRGTAKEDVCPEGTNLDRLADDGGNFIRMVNVEDGTALCGQGLAEYASYSPGRLLWPDRGRMKYWSGVLDDKPRENTALFSFLRPYHLKVLHYQTSAHLKRPVSTKFLAAAAYVTRLETHDDNGNDMVDDIARWLLWAIDDEYNHTRPEDIEKKLPETKDNAFGIINFIAARLGVVDDSVCFTDDAPPKGMWKADAVRQSSRKRLAQDASPSDWKFPSKNKTPLDTKGNEDCSVTDNRLRYDVDSHIERNGRQMTLDDTFKDRMKHAQRTVFEAIKRHLRETVESADVGRECNIGFLTLLCALPGAKCSLRAGSNTMKLMTEDLRSRGVAEMFLCAASGSTCKDSSPYPDSVIELDGVKDRVFRKPKLLYDAAQHTFYAKMGARYFVPMEPDEYRARTEPQFMYVPLTNVPFSYERALSPMRRRQLRLMAEWTNSGGTAEQWEVMNTSMPACQKGETVVEHEKGDDGNGDGDGDGDGNGDVSDSDAGFFVKYTGRK